jgi:hypothetical protein
MTNRIQSKYLCDAHWLITIHRTHQHKTGAAIMLGELAMHAGATP